MTLWLMRACFLMCVWTGRYWDNGSPYLYCVADPDLAPNYAQALPLIDGG